MNCIKCKREIPASSLFCNICGKKQVKNPRNTKSRGNGTGSVFRLPNGKWQAAVTLGYKYDENGNRKRVKRTKSGFTTKREALEYIPTLKSEKVKKLTLTICESYRHITPKLEKLSEKRQSSYRKAYTHVKSIEMRDMDSLSLSDLQAVIDKVPGGYYAKRYVKDLLSKMYAYAFADGKIDRNIVPYIELPRNEPAKEKAIFTKDEVGRLWDSWNGGDEFAGYTLILIYCAIRTGELWSIKCKDVDFNTHTMCGGIKTNKGKYAPIFIVEQIEPVIKHFVEKNPNGTLYSGYDVEFYRRWNEFKARIGLREELTPYSGRHSCATILAGAGVPEAVIMAIMRHEKYDTTLAYTHIDVKGTLSLLQSAIDKELK
jgi:integrase